MYKIILIGHRGVGKSTILKKIKSKHPEIITIDLDEEIVIRSKKSIQEIFNQEGESQFRKHEQEVFQSIVTENKNKPLVIAVGGGFLNPLPQNFQVIWLKRSMDPRDMFFIDRPNLDGAKLLTEKRFFERESFYKKNSNRSLLLREGLRQSYKSEIDFILNNSVEIKNNAIFLTLKKEVIYVLENNNLDVVFELRTDIFSEDEIKKILQNYPKKKFLLSFRTQAKIEITPNVVLADWAIELGNPKQEVSVLSWHGETPPQVNLNKFIKWSPLVSSWENIIRGHNWFLEDPTNRVFLPRSNDGRWCWYRLNQINKQKINFIKFDEEGTSKDQPSWLEYLSLNLETHNFASVLGNPVKFSHSPTFHETFFSERSMGLFPIDMKLEDCNQVNINFLYKLGLRWSAVTSPLKGKISDLIGNSSEPINTIVWNKNKWEMASTDAEGFKTLLDKCEFNTQENIVVWGGGGILVSIKKIIPKACFYSASSGSPREHSQKIENPDIIIWADNKDSVENIPAQWSPRLILDINYHKSSFGALLAMQKACQYIPGETMFTAQALAQQEFWKKFDGCQ